MRVTLLPHPSSKKPWGKNIDREVRRVAILSSNAWCWSVTELRTAVGSRAASKQRTISAFKRGS